MLPTFIVDDIEPVVSFVANNLQRYLVDESLSDSDTFAASMILSTQISDEMIELPPNSTVLLRFDNFLNSSTFTSFQCAFWDYNLRTVNGQTVGGWSTDGIIQDSSPGLPVLCNTTHLTSFAVLVSAGGSEGSLSLRIVSYIGCGISIVCLIVTIATIIVWRKRAFKGKQHLVHLNLSIALLLALITFVSGVETATDNRPACIFVTSLLHYLFLAVFSWSLCEGIMVFAMFVAPFYKGFLQKLLFYLIVGWGLPIPIVVVSAGVSHDHYGLYDDDNERWACWISDDDGAIWAFTAPMIAIIIVNYFFLAVSVYNIYKTRKYHQNLTVNEKRKFDIARTVLISILALLPLLGGTWILGLLFLFDSDSEPLAWIFTILNSLQGAAIFYFRVLRNQEIATCYKKGWERVTALTSSTFARPKDVIMFDNKQALSSSTSPPSTLQHGIALNPFSVTQLTKEELDDKSP
ncbi:adhesion G protein-coupled receptor L4-like [Dysidea avara]|uniref:adhesion G protein-coupled receptor L4-like n=1 Tax=Dysidea avara TaxID=196820 RepID=UPI0033183F11